VPVRPICELLGVSWPSQRNRIIRDPVLADVLENISVFVTNTQGQSQHREMLSLPLDFISGFLFGINATRVKEQLRERLIRYQKECYKVLAEAFQEGRLTSDPVFEELLQTDSPTVQAYKMIMAMARLARQQILLESRVEDHETRIEQLEAVLADTGRSITSDQASQLSQAVKAVAMALSKQTKRNEYGGVYGELYRKFGITGYKLLPASKFEEAMQWLTEWHEQLIGTAPF
jgi:hypothetical protein